MIIYIIITILIEEYWTKCPLEEPWHWTQGLYYKHIKLYKRFQHFMQVDIIVIRQFSKHATKELNQLGTEQLQAHQRDNKTRRDDSNQYII